MRTYYITYRNLAGDLETESIIARSERSARAIFISNHPFTTIISCTA